MAGELCVLIHGFTGSPAEILPLADALEQAGYRITAPVLPGHTGTRDDLRRATAAGWIHVVDEIVEQNLPEGPVHLIGFSMGAMISAVVASKRPVTTITMLAPAVYYARPRQVFRQMATFIKANWDKAGSDALYLQKRGDEFMMAPLHSLQQFRRLVQLGKAALPVIQVPTCIIQGDKDEIVEPQSAEFVYNTIPSLHKEVHYLADSRHMVCLDTEAQVAIQLVLTFLENPEVRLKGQHTDHTM